MQGTAFNENLTLLCLIPTVFLAHFTMWSQEWKYATVTLSHMVLLQGFGNLHICPPDNEP